MSIFEVLTVLGVIAGGYFCGKYLGHYYGLPGWIGGFVLGCILVVSAYCIFRRLIGVTGKK